MADVIRSSFDSLRFSSSPLTSNSSSLNSLQLGIPPKRRLCNRVVSVTNSFIKTVVVDFVPRISFRRQKQLQYFRVHATIAEINELKWWEKSVAPNMIDIHSEEEFASSLKEAGDRLVIVDFYGTWCASCRAIFPKICKTAEGHPEILFLKVNFDENKQLCKSLNIRVLPYFHFYRGADGLLESFSCNLSKFMKIKDAIELHNVARCNSCPPNDVGNLTLETVSGPGV